MNKVIFSGRLTAGTAAETTKTAAWRAGFPGCLHQLHGRRSVLINSRRLLPVVFTLNTNFIIYRCMI